MRDAPAIEIINLLLAAGAVIEAFDPVAAKETKKIFGERIGYGIKNYDVLRDADALLVITEWNEFREPDFEKIKSLMKNPVIFDGRNIYDGKKLNEKGFTYFSIGKKP
jgi:UDPglucose 6-dehydrogenase